MKRLCTVAMIGVAILSSVAAHATDEPRRATEQFFATLASSGPDAAFDQLFKGAPMVEKQPGAVAALKQQTVSALALYGEPLGVDLVSETELGDSVVRLNYFQKFEMAPLSWTFTFYRATDQWVAVGTDFTDKVRFHGCR